MRLAVRSRGCAPGSPGQDDAACCEEVAGRGWRGQGTPDQRALEPAAEQASGRVVELGEVLGAVGVERGEQAAAADAGDDRDAGEKAGVVEGSQAAEPEGGGPEAAAGDRHADAGLCHGHRSALVRRSCRIQRPEPGWPRGRRRDLAGPMARGHEAAGPG